ncbi:5470_t:CDS:2 [Scutellospora calospora]|uniref:5470_t:CDS:1 n=1 Tax=Scutellospora calospora TaxID=85575 RepID=A0ACA9KPN1_9GLOM|nr:5470_t:CDS:2 [Scutellospora calospora]
MQNNEENLKYSAQQSSTPSVLVKTYGDIYFNTQNTESAVKFFEELGILPKIRSCSKCKSPMRKTKDNSRACGHSTTIRSETWLARSKLSLVQIAKIMFCWSHKLPQKFAALESDVSEEKIVEIDESKFGKLSVPNRTKKTLMKILEEYIKIGTIIYSDCWAAYQTNEFEKYNPETGVHTNTIESSWRAVKSSLPRYGIVKDLYDTYFLEYM